MRIAYGVMGYGRGHSSRALAVLPALMRENEVTVFAGGDAYAMLAAHAPTVRIPTLGYGAGADGDVSFTATVARNARLIGGLLGGAGALPEVMREFRRRGIQLVISDSEAWTHQAAARLSIPRISFDHVGIIAWCKPHFPPQLALRGWRDGWGYRQLMGRPDRIIISSFYPAQPLAATTCMVGAMLRPEVHAIKPSKGSHLVAYFNRGQLQYGRAVEKVLTGLDLPVRVYGTGRSGEYENLSFRPIDAQGFLRDIASSRAVIATAGNQLMGELLHYRKPVLALPERVFEQQLNAWMVERMGVGRAARLSTFSPDDVHILLGDATACAARMEGFASDGRAQAIAELRRCIAELAGRRAPAPAESARPLVAAL